MLEFLKQLILFKISNSFFYTQKVAYFVIKDSSSPVKASNFNLLNPDLLTPYRRPNPIKIWPFYAVPHTTRCTPAQHTTCGERDHPRPFFNRLKNLSRSPRPLWSGPTNIRSSRSIPAHCRSAHFSRAGVDRVSGVNGTLQNRVSRDLKLNICISDLQLFLYSREQILYEFRFVWEQKYVG